MTAAPMMARRRSSRSESQPRGQVNRNPPRVPHAMNTATPPVSSPRRCAKIGPRVKNALVVTPHKNAATSPKGDCRNSPLRLIRVPPSSRMGATARVKAIGTKATGLILPFACALIWQPIFAFKKSLPGLIGLSYRTLGQYRRMRHWDRVNHYECEAVCPAEISATFISRLNREYAIAAAKEAIAVG